MQTKTLILTIEVEVSADKANLVVDALKRAHPENHRTHVTDLLKITGSQVSDNLIQNPKGSACVLPTEEQEEAITEWMKDQVADGNTDADDLCHRSLQWGLRSPAEVLEEIEERMGKAISALDAEPPTQLPIVEPPLAPTPLASPANDDDPRLMDALDAAEGFISGFEDDSAQEGVAETLALIRNCQKAFSDAAPVGGRTAFLAAFHALIGAVSGIEPNARYRSLWPTNGALDRDAFIESRNDAMERARDLLGVGFCTRQQADKWLTEAGWIVPDA